MRILENGPDRDSELHFASAAIAQTGPDFFLRVGFDRGEPGCVGALAMRAGNAIFPADAFQMLTGRVIGGEPLNNLNEREVIWGWVELWRFHAANLPKCHCLSSA